MLNRYYHFKLFKTSCLTILFLIISLFINAQEHLIKVDIQTNTDSAVKYIGEWPNEASKKKLSTPSNKLKDIVLGKKNCFLSKPVSMLIDSLNNIWVLDQGNNFIVQIQNDEANFPSFLLKKKFNFPSLVCIVPFRKNTFLFTDSYLKKIFVLDPTKKSCYVLNDSLHLEQPTGIAYSPVSHQIWVTETNAHRVAILSEDGKIIKEIGFRGSEKGQFNYPTHICLDNDGTAYIVDAMNFRIQLFNKQGEFISTFGTQGDATGYFARPKGIAVDSHKNIYIVDALFNAVQIFNTEGVFLYQFGTQGHDKAQFWMPSGIYIDRNDKIFIADSYNSRIQFFSTFF